MQVIAERGFAGRAPNLFGQSVEGRLVLVPCTCWTGRAYLQNVVVTAVPVS